MALLSAGLERHLDAQALSQQNRATLNPANLELLRSLGYVEGGEEGR